MNTTRIGALVIATVLAATAITACGSDDKKPSADTATTTAAATATASATSTTDSSTAMSSSAQGTTSQESTTTETSTAAAAQPATVSITTPFGTVDYPVAPKRVVAFGQSAVDNLLALGVKPVAIIGSAREKDIPWQVAAGAGDIPFVQVASFKDVKPELIASFQPDLIVGDVWRITQTSYKKLSVIAPTLGPAGYEPDQVGWKPQLLLLGKVFNDPAKAQSVIDADAARFAKAKADMPGLVGKTAFASQYIGPSNEFGVLAQPQLPANAFFIDLGMVIPPQIVNAPNQNVGQATISAENISMLNADFSVFGPRGASVAQMEAVPGFADLTQVKSGNYIVAEHEYQLQAINQPSALSRAYTLEQFTPKLRAVAGK